MRTMIWVGAVAIGLVAPAIADSFNGHELHAICTANDDAPTKAYVTGYIAGMIVGEEGANPDSSFRCIPKDVNGRQLRETVCRYVGQHPELRDLTVLHATRFAVKATWPCQTKP